jgi:hypothetical protein
MQKRKLNVTILGRAHIHREVVTKVFNKRFARVNEWKSYHAIHSVTFPHLQRMPSLSAFAFRCEQPANEDTFYFSCQNNGTCMNNAYCQCPPGWTFDNVGFTHQPSEFTKSSKSLDGKID